MTYTIQEMRQDSIALSKYYSWQDAKSDSDKNLKPRREHQIRVAAWKEFGMTLITIIAITPFAALLTINV
jgi:hypothetical protein